jgi:SAM-dependent methyltransferase
MGYPMTLTIQILFGIIFLFLIVGAAWRLSSRRTSLPCPSWLAWLFELESPFAKNYNASSIIRSLDLGPGMKVLDAGCGPGRVTIPLARAVGPQGEVVAIDIQPRMLKRARDKARAASLSNIRFQELSIGESTLGNAEFDRVLLVTVLGEIPDRVGALREIHRALKPGGILSITEIMADPHYQSRRAILRLGNSAGFRENAFWGNRFAFTLHLEKMAKD